MRVVGELLDQPADDPFGLQFFGEPLIAGGAPCGIPRGHVGGGSQLAGFFRAQPLIAFVEPVQHGLPFRVEFAALLVEPGLLLGEFAAMVVEGGVQLLIIQHEGLPRLLDSQPRVVFAPHRLRDLRPGFLHGQTQFERRAMRIFQFGPQPFQAEPFAGQLFVLLQQQFVAALQFGLLTAAFVLPSPPLILEQLPICVDGRRPGRAAFEDGFVLPFDGPREFVHCLAVRLELPLATVHLLDVVGQLLTCSLALETKIRLSAFQIVADLLQVFLLEPQPVFQQHALPLQFVLKLLQRLFVSRTVSGPLGFPGGTAVGQVPLEFGDSLVAVVLPLLQELLVLPLLLGQLLLCFGELLPLDRTFIFPGSAFGVPFGAATLPFLGEVFPKRLTLRLQPPIHLFLNPQFFGSQPCPLLLQEFALRIELRAQTDQFDTLGGEFFAQCRAEVLAIRLQLALGRHEGTGLFVEFPLALVKGGLLFAQPVFRLEDFAALRCLLATERDSLLIQLFRLLAQQFFAVFEFGELFDGLLNQQPGATRRAGRGVCVGCRRGLRGRRMRTSRLRWIDAQIAPPHGHGGGRAGSDNCLGKWDGRRAGEERRRNTCRLGHDGNPFPKAEKTNSPIRGTERAGFRWALNFVAWRGSRRQPFHRPGPRQPWPE